MKSIIVGAFICLNCSICTAQLHPFLSYFTAIQDKSQVILQWEIFAGNTCAGTDIFRSTDNVQYKLIGQILGICGNISKPENYTFVDTMPILNSNNFYKLALGSAGESKSISIYIADTKNLGYQIRPNPHLGEMELFFENPLNLEHSITIFDSQGRELSNYTVNGSRFIIHNMNNPSTVYYFTIRNHTGKSINGSFLKF